MHVRLPVVFAVFVVASTVASAQTSQARYTIQVSDVVALSYRYTPEFDYAGPVQPDGYITVPLLGAIRIVGLTVESARDAVLQKAQLRLRDPELSFVLKEFRMPLFTVLGEVEKPGQFELHGRIGVLEAVALAGGFKRSAKHSQVVLLRRADNDRASALLIDAKQLAQTPDPEHDIPLEMGDTLFIPQSVLSKVERFIPFASLILLNPFVIW